MQKVITFSLIICLLLIGSYFALYPFLAQRFTVPGVSDYVAMAKPWIPTVQAIYDYKADHGAMPRQLADLVPTYLPQMPTDPNGLMFSYSEYSLDIHAPVPHTGIVYSFLPGQEGWSVGGDFGVGPLPLPKVASTHPATRQSAAKKRRRSTAPSTLPKATHGEQN